MKIIIFLTLIIFIKNISGREDITKCKKISTFNYGYEKFFQITDSATHSYGSLKLEFKVKSKSDAHVLLSTTSDTPTSDILQAYEIVIGGGKNTFSQIRLLKKGAKATETIPDLLSEYDYRGFWISYNKSENIIMVGKENTQEPFLFWKNPQLIPIKYFSFGSWVNVKADWLFACPDEDDPEFVEVEISYTAPQKLQRDLLDLYDSFTVPNELNKLLVVKTSFSFYNVHLDEKTGVINVDGVANLKWNDNKLSWKPENYEGIDVQHLTTAHVWTPNLKILSGLQYGNILDYDRGGIVLKSNGDVYWRTEFHFSTYCNLNTKNWPHDVHNCSFHVGFRSDPENLVIELVESEMKIAEERTNSEWDIINIIPYNVIPDKNSAVKGSAVGLYIVTLKRRDQSYGVILLTPLYAASIMILASFWIDPDHSGQLLLCCGTLIILVIMFVDIGETIPAMQDETPDIVFLYSWCIILTCVPLLLHVCLKNLSQRVQLPGIIISVLNSNITKMICLLPGSSQDQTIYAKLNENQQEQDKHNEMKIHLSKFAVAVQRIFFAWYIILFSFLLFFVNK